MRLYIDKWCTHVLVWVLFTDWKRLWRCNVYMDSFFALICLWLWFLLSVIICYNFCVEYRYAFPWLIYRTNLTVLKDIIHVPFPFFVYIYPLYIHYYILFFQHRVQAYKPVSASFVAVRQSPCQDYRLCCLVNERFQFELLLGKMCFWDCWHGKKCYWDCEGIWMGEIWPNGELRQHMEANIWWTFKHLLNWTFMRKK